ncbi:hypothetical protein VNO78_02444 [Psophocarpus tetragonolobus]|uniref:Protein POLLEN DEFECTIVE IN GUIDANCE 1 n=1 Tax=Psophocarpus tetragonolobus TaxID=3891 RepID=A0AAN9XW15_PSOTE
MALRNGGTFDVLSVDNESDQSERHRRKRRNRASKRKKKLLDRADSVDPHSTPLENGGACNGFELDANRYCGGRGSVVVCEEVREAESEAPTTVRGGIEGFNFGELRQRNVNCGSSEDLAASVVVREEKEDGGVKASPVEKPTNEPDRNALTKLETVESLDWKRLMTDDPNYVFSVEKSPVTYFLEEMHNGNSLRNTTTLGNERERERVYDTIFRLPWRCELLIDVGFFVCFDSFLSLLTVMPARIMMTIWRLLKTRQFKRLSTIEVSDFGCFFIMSCGVILLQRTDISLIYHMIRGQGTIKLYVVYNVLEIFDKLCQSFNGDVLQTLFLSAEGIANCPQESMRFWIWRFVSDQALAAITLSTCIVAHNNALFALLVSNNFAEIKSNVFKRYSKDNVHSLVYFDSVERFHISAFILFVLAQNILEAEDPWFGSFFINVLLVYVCEMIIDIIKHSFIAKFNDIKPIAYSEFLEDLCKQRHVTQNAKPFGILILPFLTLTGKCQSIIPFPQAWFAKKLHRSLSPVRCSHPLSCPRRWPAANSWHLCNQANTTPLSTFLTHPHTTTVYITFSAVHTPAHSISKSRYLISLHTIAGLPLVSCWSKEGKNHQMTLNMQTESEKKNLTFVPLAPACVVIRVLTPVYAANLPHNPLPWRLFWILLFSAMTYVMLTSLKVLIGMGLQKHATWYVNRCRRRKHHLHAD